AEASGRVGVGQRWARRPCRIHRVAMRVRGGQQAQSTLGYCNRLLVLPPPPVALELDGFGLGFGLVGEEAEPLVAASAGVLAAQVDEDFGEAAVEEEVRDEVGAVRGLGLGHAAEDAGDEVAGALAKIGGARVFGGEGADVLGGMPEEL